jgi:glycosyltransferase involved in cell wall biosynthesis
LRRLARLKRKFLPLPSVRAAQNSALRQAVVTHGPYDLAVVQQLRTAPYLALVGHARRWFDQVDVWSLFLEQEIAARTPLMRPSAALQRREFRRAENTYAARSDVLTTAGWSDAEEIRRRTGKPVTWLPTPSPLRTELRSGTRPDRPTAGLLANFGYWPNRDAYDVLRETWLPILRDHGWNVVVAGYGSDELAHAPGICNLGPVGIPRDFYDRVNVVLAPIRRGGGIKVKVLEAFAANRPVVATDYALRGFPPALRDYALRVPPDGTGLDRLPAWLTQVQAVPETVLEVFTLASFTATVERLLIDA